MIGIASAAETKAAPDKQNIVVKVSHGTDDLHAAIMALKISKMLQMKGAQTTLFVNLEGVRLLDNRVSADLAWGHTPSVGKLIDEVMKAGVRVVVCPHCAMIAGIPEKHLRAGAILATEESMADMFLAADKVIDY